jgi:hypothetical protein
LQALDVPATSSNPAGGEPSDDAASLLPTALIIDNEPLAEIDE